MEIAVSIRQSVCVMAVTFALGTTAHAQALRTFVSGSNGNDSNTASNCPHTAPCRTLANALTVTVPGGEIQALDPAGYGVFTAGISNGSILLTGVPGASINPTTGQAGITMNGTGSTLIVDNFEITGNNASNTTGIAVNSGKLVLRNSTLKLLTNGITVNTGSGASVARADILNSDIINNGTGITTYGPGASFNSGTGFYDNTTCPAPPTPSCPTIVRITGGSTVGSSVAAFTEVNPTSSSGVPSATIWVSNNLANNVAGNKAYVTTSGLGAGSVSPQGYGPGQSPY